MKTLVNEFRLRLPASSRRARRQRPRRRGARPLRRGPRVGSAACRAPALPAIVGDGTSCARDPQPGPERAHAVAEQSDAGSGSSPGGAQRKWRVRAVRWSSSQWARVFREGAEARVRALCHHQEEGHRLGLAVVKKIADEHGARILIANLGTLGEAGAPRRAAWSGASFAIIFQTRDDGRRRERARRDAGALSFNGHYSFVDDELGIRALLSEILADEGQRSSWRTRRRAPAAGASAPTWSCSTSGCPTSRHHAAEGVPTAQLNMP